MCLRCATLLLLSNELRIDLIAYEFLRVLDEHFTSELLIVRTPAHESAVVCTRLYHWLLVKTLPAATHAMQRPTSTRHTQLQSRDA
jgi:hypothetical protein